MKITRAQRLERVKRLRTMKAPLWIVRSEQVALACLRRGVKAPNIKSGANNYAHNLLVKYVHPLMGAES